MRKYYLSLFVALVAAIVVGGCKGDTPEVEPQPQPQPNPEKPVVVLTSVETTETTFTFDIESSLSGTYGFFYAKDAEKVDVPDMPTWFDYNQGKVEDKTTVTIEDLDDGWDYTLYLVVRADANSLLSAVQKLQFKTPAKDNYIVIDNMTHDAIDFTINIEGTYLFTVVEDVYLSESGYTELMWLELFGILSGGQRSYHWYDGGSYDSVYAMSVKPGCNYTIAAVECASDKTVTGEVRFKKIKTPAKPQTEESIDIQLSDITATSVKITATPSENVSNYYIYMLPKANFDSFVESYGSEVVVSIIKESDLSWWISNNVVTERVWEGLNPSTEYTVAVVVIDKSGAETLENTPFTTLAPSAAAPELEVSLMSSPNGGYEAMAIVVKTQNAASIKYAFAPTADVDKERTDYEKSDSAIVADRGADFTPEQVAEANSAQGCVIERTDLWFDTEYTLIVSAKNNELVESLDVKVAKTEVLPTVARVDSQLFETLVGKWELSYSFIDYNNVERSIDGAVVTIAQGMDDYSNELYRSQNRLVILDWAFQHDYEENPFETPYPADYMGADDYWKNNPTLAYRDYGPKLFLQIAEGDVVTMPTARNSYFYNERPVGGYCMYFYGTDYAMASNAPVSFPVEVSADGNTITIKPYYDSTGIFLQGATYYPTIWRNETEIWNMATSEIVLRRVE